MAGYSRTSFNVDDRVSSGASDNYHVGLYGAAAWGALAFRSGLAYTRYNIDTRRSVSIPGVGDSLRGSYDAATTQVFGEFGYGVRGGRIALEPFANLAYVNLHTDSFIENGGVAALTGTSGTIGVTFATLGLRGSTAFDLNGARLTMKGMLGWRHAFGDVTPDTTMRFAAGGNAFTVGGVPVARDAAVAEAGLDYALSSAATLGVSYGAQFGGGVTDQSFKANLNVKF